tara:strand:- start:232 stop:924 length:693 start_codon:yes stop_codon:yes gene_type:complete
MKSKLKKTLPKFIVSLIKNPLSPKIFIKKYILSKDIISTHKYKDYQEYLNHQKEKTTDKKRIEKWLNEEWESKYEGFKEIFDRNKRYVDDKNNAICLGARTGQEVKALIDRGIDSIGIDLVPFEPYTIKGDIHNLSQADSSYDLVFTNIYDHSLYPDKFCSEMERVCKSSGIIIIHIQLGIDGDKYSENIINNPDYIIENFKDSTLCESKSIKNTFDGMNWEIILRKNNF